MKRFFICILAFFLLLSLPACGKKKEKKTELEQLTNNAVVSAQAEVYEVEITLENIFDYFDFKQYRSNYTDEKGNVSSVLISYGLQLKEGYYAANSSEYKDTMTISFTAEGVVNTGNFDVDFDTLQYTGTAADTSYVTVSEELSFWPKGNRTTTWSFGLYSSSYVNYFQNFYINEAKGKIYIKTTP